MTDIELAQRALPKGFAPDVSAWLEVNTDNEVRNAMLSMFLAGMAKAREIDAGICDGITQQAKQDSHTPFLTKDGVSAYTSFGMGSYSCASAIRSQGKK
jgi:hypothetical protein